MRTNENTMVFLESLFSTWMDKELGEIEIRPIKNGSAHGEFFDSEEEAAKCAVKHSRAGFDTFAGVNLRQGKNGTKEGIEYVTALHADIDFGTIGHKKPSQYKTSTEALGAINAFKLAPTLVVNSAGGFHCYWLLNEAVTVSKVGAEKIETIIKNISQKLGGDPGTQDISRILRVPGTKNYKIPGEPRDCKIEKNSGPHYDLKDFAEYEKETSKKEKSSGNVDDLRVTAACKMLIKNGMPAGQRSEALASVLCSLSKAGYSDAEIKPIVLNNLIGEKAREKKSGVDRWLQSEIASARATVGTTPETTTEYRHTDMGNAERLVGKFGQDIRYCTPRNKWLTWTGSHWQYDEKTKIEVMAKSTVRDIIAEAMTADGEKFKEIAQHAARSENLTRVRAMITLAQSEPDIPILPGELDTDPWLLNVKNGTIDLRTGVIREPKKDDLITSYIDVPYTPGAACPTWLAFLDKVMGENDRLIDFLHRSVGYSLSGDIREQCLFFNYGRGANGKSTFMETVSRLLGPYSKNTRPETFMLKNSDGVNNDLAELQNVRLVAAVELEEGKRLAEVLTKQISGGDTVKARYLYEEFFEFRPQFKLWLCGNHKPQIRGTDHAIWRRIRLIPWTVTIPDAEQDRGLLEKLLTELPGILAWAVEGCLKWQHDGLTAPDEVMAATATYRKEQDILGDFFESCVITDKNSTISVKDLYAGYIKFCDDNGEGIRERLGKKKFNDRVADRGFDSWRAGRNVLTWIGLDVSKE